MTSFPTSLGTSSADEIRLLGRDLTAEPLRRAPAAEIYGVIGNGRRAMFGMAQMIPSADRWAIVAYVRALQLSQDAVVASLPPDDRARLEATR